MGPSDEAARLSELEREVARLRKKLGLQAKAETPLELSRTEQLLLDAQRIAHMGSWTWNLSRDQIAWSDELYRIFGLSPEEITPSAPVFFAAIHPDDRARVQDAGRRVLQKKEAEDIDFRIVRPSGEERQVHMESAFVDCADGPRTLVVGTVLDETDKKRAATLLARTVSVLNDAQRIAGLGSWYWHLPDGHLDWSEGMFRLLGLDGSEQPSEALFYQHVHPDDLARARATADQAAATGVPRALELRMVRKDGSVRDATLRSCAVFDEQSKLSGFYGILQDVTEFRAFEEAARHTQKMEAIGTLAGGVAHDFNNYLMVLGGHVELLSISLPEEHPARSSLAAIQLAYERCASLTEQLLTLSRRRSPKPCAFDLARRIEAAAPMLRSALGSNIELKLDLEQHAPFVRADPDQVEHALMNLALNARDGMPDGGTLTLRVTAIFIEPHPEAGLAEGYYVRLSVADTGCGIPDELRSRIFEPFFTTKAVGKGTGLGLAVVYGIVRDADGGIEVDSCLGQGTTFHLFFRPAEGKVLETRSSHVGAETSGTGQRILVVEDVTVVRELLRAQLAHAGYEVFVAADGLAALSLLASQSVDAVLSDVVMPNMGGLELVHTLQERYPKLPCLLMSGYSDLTVPEARKDLSVALLQKPFTSRELRVALADLLRQSPNRQLSFGQGG